jgi:hypothetical protein
MSSELEAMTLVLWLGEGAFSGVHIISEVVSLAA